MPTICAAFQATAARYPNRVAVRLCGEGIEWSWDEYAVRVRRAAQTLHALGVRRGDRVALLLGERPEHLLADLAVVHLGAVPFSICGTSAPPHVEYIVRDSGARLLISEAAYQASAAAVAARCGALEHVVGITSGAPELDSVDSPAFDFEQSWRAVTPEDLVCLIYTSGTTGPPRRAEITHQSVLAGLRGTWGTLSVPATVPPVSVLPLAHVVGRFIVHYSAIALAATVTCCADAAALPAALAETRGTAFGAPRWVWQKPPCAWAALGADPKHLFATAQLGQLELARLVGATAAVALLDLFQAAAAVSSRQSRGVIEAGCAGTTHTDDGTSGRPIDTLELTIAADRAVFAPRPIVIRGYHDLPQHLAEAIRQHCRLHTRNFGGLDNQWRLTITDRTRPLIMDTSGKDMPAANIKADPNSATPLIGQAASIGNEHPINAAPIRLDPEHVAIGEHDTARAGESASAVQPRRRAPLPRPADQAPHDPRGRHCLVPSGSTSRPARPCGRAHDGSPAD